MDAYLMRLLLKNLIRYHCLKLGQFVLVCGETSSYYYDLKSIMFDGPTLNMISELLLREVDRFDVKSVGGMGLGAGPLISAVALKGNMKGFYIRKKAKQNGIGKRVEGHFEPPALVLDDVINNGNSVMKAIDIIGRRYIAGVVCIVDREVDENLLQQNGIKYYSLFKHSDFAAQLQ
ncbi:MAG TPA: hypothetical protein VEL11_01060 [Candidatus Bathyarchaeia archaeon]|nr:hypothetical protein [Candidatus Bathyarchaeia archaeon]